ncbi:MAG: helix-hairpin-helix domain-containing protein [Myxococcota bacterium]
MPRAPLRLAFFVCAFAPVAVFAADYETDIDIESEQDLYDLATRGEISDETLQTLVELLRDGVELNRATRDELYGLPGLSYAEVEAILLYRQKATRIDDPAQLVGAGALTPEQLSRIAPFLVVEPAQTPLPVSGRLRAVSAVSTADPLAPPGFLQARLKLPADLSASVVLLSTRYRLGPVIHDTVRDALAAAPPAYSLRAPKFYLQWKRAERMAVAGTFRLGFAQRLTLDNTTRQTPDGIYPDDVVLIDGDDLTKGCKLSAGELSDSPCDEAARNTYVTPDFFVRDGFRGLAGSLRELEIGAGRISLYGFASFQSRSVYQYEIFDRRRCPDPRDDGDPACGAPQVFVRQENAFAPAARYSFQTLPDAWDELASGGRIELKAGQLRLGTTGYYAAPFWKVEGIALDFQEWAKYPFGGSFGAAGADGALLLGPWSFFLEGSRSFDRLPGGGGGFGVLQRSVFSPKRQEVELSLRYYDKKFVNPYGRPLSGPDEFQGQRARNEAGVRLRYDGRAIPDWQLRGSVDFWVWPQDGDAQGTAGLANLYTFARADFLGWELFSPGVWVDYRNKELRQNGAGLCYETSTEENELGEGLPCSGEFYRVAARVRLSPVGPGLTVTLQYQRAFLGDPNYPTSLRQDQVVWGEIAMRPADSVRMRVRSRWLFEDVEDNTRLENSLWNTLDVTWLAAAQFHARLRYDVYVYLDQRASTALRQPKPEQRFRLELETRF